jgi:hypothetical protein
MDIPLVVVNSAVGRLIDVGLREVATEHGTAVMAVLIVGALLVALRHTVAARLLGGALLHALGRVDLVAGTFAVAAAGAAGVVVGVAVGRELVLACRPGAWDWLGGECASVAATAHACSPRAAWW